MKKAFLSYSYLLLFFVLITACTENTKNQQESTNTTASSEKMSLNDLGKYQKLVGKWLLEDPSAEAKVFFKFIEDGSFTQKTGDNLVFGTWEVLEDGTIIIVIENEKVEKMEILELNEETIQLKTDAEGGKSASLLFKRML